MPLSFDHLAMLLCQPPSEPCESELYFWTLIVALHVFALGGGK
jgi:hypothetical protein